MPIPSALTLFPVNFRTLHTFITLIHRDMPLKSYTGKIYSLLVSEFRHVLMIDADCMPVQVSEETGAAIGQTGGGGRGALRGWRGGHWP